jgi:Tol biopolymer transport system component
MRKNHLPVLFLLFFVLLVGFFLLQRFFLLKDKVSPVAWKDICVESVKVVAVGQTKPFSPWSPDGEWIAYSNYFTEEEKVKVTEPVGVYVIKYDGTGKRLVAPDGFRPSFGRFQWQIVYGKAGKTDKPGYKGLPEEDIWIVNFDGSRNRPVAGSEEDAKMKNYGGSSITYDGKSVVYNILKEGKGGGVGIVGIDGTNERRLVTNSGVWGYSSDGKKVFVESVDKAKPGYVTGGWLDIKDAGVDTEGEGIEKVNWVTAIKYPTNHYGHPQVNFEGTKIVYDSPDIDAGPFDIREIWIGLLDGSNSHYQLTDTPGASFANHPRWSPDGGWVVYDEQTFIDKGVKDKVMIVNVATEEKKEIAGMIVPTQSGWTEPGWSPDGRKIFFYAPDINNENKPSIWIATLKECSGK